ncbi:PREDICTED: uncharacterized protein LOC108569765 [Nicrophorus vespilloides]|uniref:Uncharacterized protein LOC108569765 n=1 Tax=Nicrophorus vespilloides TaxID=110193 RepID=A0ABM1NJD3_NICVS|nr:PREDICTED: uncharacterized protein LOC108569765 [Nicrophorus vespilloides]
MNSQSVMLHAVPVWEEAMMVKSYRRLLETVQRKSAIRICSAYRTISRDAVKVIAGMPPIELLATERKETDCGKDDKLQRSARVWTRRLIPEIKAWINRNHDEVTLHLTQALSGQGCFSKYLHFIAKKEDDKCWYCEDNDNPEHTLFSCCKEAGN